MCQLQKGTKLGLKAFYELETGNWLCMAVWFACLFCSLRVSQDKSVLAIFSNLLLGMRLQLRKQHVFHLLEGDCHEQKQISSLMEDPEGDGVPETMWVCYENMAPQIQRFITSRILEPCPYISVNYNDLTATSL